LHDVRVFSALEGVKVTDVSKLAKHIRGERLSTFRNLRRNYKFTLDKVREIIHERAKKATTAKERKEEDLRCDLENMAKHVVELREEVDRLRGVIRIMESEKSEKGAEKAGMDAKPTCSRKVNALRMSHCREI
jgi:hypothetical protein